LFLWNALKRGEYKLNTFTKHVLILVLMECLKKGPSVQAVGGLKLF